MNRWFEEIPYGPLTREDYDRLGVSFYDERSEDAQLVARKCGIQKGEVLDLYLGEMIARAKAARAELQPILPYSFHEINSPDQFLVREHLTEFQETYAPHISRTYDGKVFGMLGGSSQRRYRTRQIPSPEELDLIVRERTEVGFRPSASPNYLTTAVQVGSVLGFVDRMKEGTLPYFWGLSNEKIEFLTIMDGVLRQQIGHKNLSG